MAHEDLLDRIKRLDVQTIGYMSPEVIARLTHNFDEILVKNMLYTATTNYEQRKLIKIIKKAYKSWKKDTDMLWGSMPQLESYPEYMGELQTDIECGLVITEKGVFEEDCARLNISLIPSHAKPVKEFQKGFQTALKTEDHSVVSQVTTSEQQSFIEKQAARIKELESKVEELKPKREVANNDDWVVELFSHFCYEDVQVAQSIIDEMRDKTDPEIADIIFERKNKKEISPLTKNIEMWRVLHAAKILESDSYQNLNTALKRRKDRK